MTALVMNTVVNPLRPVGKFFVAIWMGLMAAGEAAGRARAAQQLHNLGYHAEAKRLMTTGYIND